MMEFETGSYKQTVCPFSFARSSWGRSQLNSMHVNLWTSFHPFLFAFFKLYRNMVAMSAKFTWGGNSFRMLLLEHTTWQSDLQTELAIMGPPSLLLPLCPLDLSPLWSVSCHQLTHTHLPPLSLHTHAHTHLRTKSIFVSVFASLPVCMSEHWSLWKPVCGLSFTGRGAGGVLDSCF